MKIGIIGTGALGSSLAINYAANKKKVNIWNRTAINVGKLSDLNNRTNQKRPFINFLKYCNIKNSVEEVVQGSTTVLLCINAQSVHVFLRKYSHFLRSKTVVFCSKGIDTKSLLLQTEIGEKFLEQKQLAVLTGPGFSADIISQKPIALTLACLNEKTGKTIQDLLSTPSIRTYLSSDIIGLLLPLTVSAGSLDLYDHVIDPVSLFKAINSPDPVLTTTIFVSITALLKTSPFTFVVHSIEPSFWSRAITFPSISATTKIPKPAAVPEDKKANSLDQLFVPVSISIDETVPSESEKNKL